MKQFVHFFRFYSSIWLLVCVILPVTAYAESWLNRIAPPPITGDTYEVATAEQLAWIAKESETSDFAGKKVKLTADIDLLGSPYLWIPIGSIIPFQGEFDGQNHAIRNLFYYSAEQPSYGIFGSIGANGQVHHLALASAEIASEKGYVGAIAGINGGHIHHCFSLARILDAKQPVGGLVGENRSGALIEYCYNAGVLLVKSGGLVGSNAGTIRHCYAAGYVNQGDAVVEDNTNGICEDIHFDSQLTAQTNNGGKLLKGITSHLTSEMTGAVFTGQEESAHWTQQTHRYPQLAVFAGTDASIVSATPAYLSFKEDVTPEAASMVTKDFTLQTDGIDKWNCDSTRTNTGELILSVSYGAVTVKRPCMQTPSYLRVYKGHDLKWVYINPQPFNPFVPCDINISDSLLVCPLIGVPMKKYTTPAKFGKDDDSENYPYYYKVDKYSIPAAGDTVYVETFGPMNHKEYEKFELLTGEKGKYAYYIRSKDSQCEADYIKGNGVLVVVVAGEFDAGAIDSVTIDTLYTSFPHELTVQSLLPATGGDEQMTYRWSYDQYSIPDDKRLRHDEIVGGVRTPLDSVACFLEVTDPGRYVFRREAHDGKCRPDFNEALGTTSRGIKQIAAFDLFESGSIQGSCSSSDTLRFCNTNDAKTMILHQTLPPSGGDLHYMFRWVLSTDGYSDVIPDETDSILAFNHLSFENGRTYHIHREVKDDTRFTDWTPSKDTLVIIFYKAFSAGAITDSELPIVCWDAETMQHISLSAEELASPTGDGVMDYSWQLIINGTRSVSLPFRTSSAEIEFNPADYATLPATFTLQRFVHNSLCGDESAQSEGGVSVRVGQPESSFEELLICGDAPETYTYTNRDGKTYSHTFTTNQESFTFYDLTPDGCDKTHTVRSTLKPVPKVSVSMTDNLCRWDSTLSFTYRVQKGKPAFAHIEFGPFFQRLGVKPMDIALHDSQDVTFTVPYLAPGDYELYVSFYEDSTGTCMSAPDTLAFSMDLSGYVYRKWEDVLFVDNNPVNSIPDAAMDLSFVAYQWYRIDYDPAGNEVVILLEGETNQFYYAPAGLNGIYFVMLTTTSGEVFRSCNIEARPDTHISSVLSDKSLRFIPCPARSNEIIRLSKPCTRIRIYNIDGHLISDIEEQTTSFVAPAAAGFYLVEVQLSVGQTLCAGLIIQQ